MGGRVALHLAGDHRVGAVAALAPWVDPADRPRWHRGLHLLVMHGTRDRITSPRRSKDYADALAALGADVTYVPVPGVTHAMVRQARRWHEESARYLVGHLLADGGAQPA
jgi:dienelactone hydrolase